MMPFKLEKKNVDSSDFTVDEFWLETVENVGEHFAKENSPKLSKL